MSWLSPFMEKLVRPTRPWRTRDPHQQRVAMHQNRTDNELGRINRIVKRRKRKGRLSRKWGRAFARAHAGA